MVLMPMRAQGKASFFDDVIRIKKTLTLRLEHLREESMLVVTKQIKMGLSKRAVIVLVTDMLVTGVVMVKIIKEQRVCMAWDRTRKTMGEHRS